MDFRQLESFISIAANKSFSKAAKELYLTQPTLSNHMQNLEKEIGTLLLNRNNREISLTRAGEIFYDYAQKLLSLKENAQYNLGKFVGKIEGTLTISASTIPEQYILPNLLMTFNGLYPHITYKINHLDSFEIIESIKDCKIPYGFTGSFFKDSSLEYLSIMKDELVLITPIDFENNSTVISLKDLLTIPLVIREEGSGTRNLFAKELKKHKINIYDLNIKAMAENTQTIKSLVQSGICCSILSSKAIENEVNLGLLKKYTITDLNLERDFYFVYPKERIFSSLEDNFIKFISSKFK